jgi:hypothetical protein
MMIQMEALYSRIAVFCVLKCIHLTIGFSPLLFRTTMMTTMMMMTMR